MKKLNMTNEQLKRVARFMESKKSQRIPFDDDSLNMEAYSLYKQLEEAGIPVESHESDMYFPVTPESQAIVDNYEFKNNVTTFESGGELWFDAPFSFDPYWDKMSRKRATQDNQAWDLFEKCKEALGPEGLLQEIVLSMSTEEAIETFEFISRMHDLDYEEEEDW